MAAKKVTLVQVATHVCGSLEGSGQTELCGIAELHLAVPGDLSFVIKDEHLELAGNTQASAVLIDESLSPVCLPMVRVKNVPQAINAVLDLFAHPRPQRAGIHPSALVAPDASLAKDVAIGPCTVIEPGAQIGQATVIEAGCYIGHRCLIGDGCHLFQNVIVADHCLLGHRVILAENVVIGSEGFGYRPQGNQHHKVPHLGAVRIEDDVEIGACTCVDRAKFGFTVVGRGTKIDNLVSIAHNVQVGEHCLIAAQTGVAGSARLGSRVVFGGQVGVRDNIRLGDGVIAGARTAIHHDLPAGSVVLGVPALDRRQQLREQAALRKLPKLSGKIKKIEQRLAQLESATNHSQRD